MARLGVRKLLTKSVLMVIQCSLKLLSMSQLLPPTKLARGVPNEEESIVVFEDEILFCIVLFLGKNQTWIASLVHSIA